MPAPSPPPRPIPVTILTGFLGAGKTTLLNQVLTTQHGSRIAVIENEFCEVGIDHELVIHADEEIFEMNNGCICCTVRSDLIRILGKLRRRRDRFDHVFIETTGLANPGPVLQTFFADDDLRDDFQVRSVVTVVDAQHFLQDVRSLEEVGAQVAFADVILINKCDLSGTETQAQVEALLQVINPAAAFMRGSHSRVDIPALLNTRSFDLARLLRRDPGWLEEHQHDHEHDAGDDKKPLHDSSITSVGITSDGEMDGTRLITWLAGVVLAQGADLFRMKGVFALQGDPRKVVVQSVHHVFMNGEQAGEWGEQPRHCSVVFIGRNLDRQQLNADFQNCLA